MSQCVPNWDLDENPAPPRHSGSSNPSYEVAELTWSNGQLSMHGLVGPPRVANKPSVASPPTWEKPRGSGTLESIVNQATRHIGSLKSTVDAVGDSVNELVPWFDPRAAMVKPPTSASNTVTMDALVPCNKRKKGGDEVSMVGCSTRVGSCSGAQNGGGVWVAPVARASNVSESESATCGDLRGTLFTSTTSLGSPENTSSGNDYTKVSTDDYDSLCHTRSQRDAAYNAEGKKKLGINGKSSVSTKRSRAAAIHNQSERKRRDKINQKMKTLQKLVPNSNKTDKASMLDEVIEYLKQLQAQVQMMRGMNMPSMMLPMAMQQQFQMSMMGMAGMGMGMGMGVMDMNTISRAAAASVMPPVMPPAAAFMQAQPSWGDPGLDRVPPNPASMMQPDPLSAFLACQQSQPMTTFDAYNRMAAMYQQLQQNPGYNGSHK